MAVSYFVMDQRKMSEGEPAPKESPSSEAPRKWSDLIGQLNNIASHLIVVTWIIWGCLRIPYASSLDELRRYETLTGAAEVPILLLLVMLFIFLKPLISKEVCIKEWLRSYNFIFAITSLVLFILASCIWCDRVIRNEPPRITGIWVEDATLVPLVRSRIEAKATDPDGGEPFFLWVSDQVPFEQLSKNEISYQAPLVAGEYLITVIVFDKKGAYDTKEVRIYVIGQQTE
jgi:hypothetical protein